MFLIYVFIDIQTFLIGGGVVRYVFTSLNYVYLIVDFPKLCIFNCCSCIPNVASSLNLLTCASATRGYSQTTDGIVLSPTRALEFGRCGGN